MHTYELMRASTSAFLLSGDNNNKKLLTSLLKEAGWGDKSKDEEEDGGEIVTVPIEWVVDIADKDNDWFLATAYGYNDAKQTLHVMVPDRNAPTWTGDVAVNKLVRFLFFRVCLR